jgi:hypothetical protein
MRLNEFYADPKRASSEEVNFGSAWRTQGEGPWKVVWMVATGELVAFNEQTHRRWSTGHGERAVEGLAVVLGAHYEAGWGSNDEVVIMGVEPDLLRLRGALIGWEDHMPEENGLAWLADRADGLSQGHAG